MKNTLIMAALVAASTCAFADPVPATQGTPAVSGTYNLTFTGSIYTGNIDITTDSTGTATAATGTISGNGNVYNVLGIGTYGQAPFDPNPNMLFLSPAFADYTGIAFQTDGLNSALAFNFFDGNNPGVDPNSISNYLLCASDQSADGCAVDADAVDTIISANVAAVPEPATWAMMLLGFCGMAFAMRRRKATALHQVAAEA